jgi:hypothetical protein
MTMDLSVIGIVFAIILFIIFFAAIILYLSFRIKETFKEEKKRGMLVVKLAFLIGILFLAGGSLYFFAQILTPATNDTFPANGGQEQKPQLSLFISYPPEVRLNSQFTMTFTITNPTEFTAHDVIVQTSSIFETLNILSTSHKVTGNIIEVEDVTSGTTVISLELIVQGRPRDVNGNIALTFREMDEPITKSINISVKGGP